VKFLSDTPEGTPERRFWGALAARLVTEVVHYFQVLLMAALLASVVASAGRTWAGPFLTIGAWCSPLPVGVSYALNLRSENPNSLRCRLRSYAVAGAVAAVIYVVLRTYSA